MIRRIKAFNLLLFASLVSIALGAMVLISGGDNQAKYIVYWALMWLSAQFSYIGLLRTNGRVSKDADAALSIAERAQAMTDRCLTILSRQRDDIEFLLEHGPGQPNWTDEAIVRRAEIERRLMGQ